MVSTPVSEDKNTFSVSGTDAGTYNMELDQTPPSVFKNNNTNYSVTFDITDGWLKINPAKLAIKVKGAEKTVTYNGQEQTLGQSLQFTVESDLPEGVTVEQKAKVVQEAKGTNVGTYPQNLTEDNLVVTGENAGNYTVSIEVVSAGFLKIDPLEVTVKIVVFTTPLATRFRR